MKLNETINEKVRTLITLAFKQALDYELTLSDFWNDSPIEEWLSDPYYSAYFDAILEKWFEDKNYNVKINANTTCFDLYNQLINLK